MKKTIDFQNMIGPSGKKWLVLGIIIILAVIIPLMGITVSIPPGQVGVVFSKFGDTPDVEGRFIVEKGEKGY
jgi:hypothetical protein